MAETPTLRGFRTVRITKEKLLKAIEKNAEDHKQIFEQALAGWEEQVAKDLSDAAKDARAKRGFRIRFNLPRPEDHSDDYESVIELLKMSEDDEFELNWSEFVNYVMDRWDWQADFLATSSAYGSTLSDAKARSLNIRN